MTAKPGLRYISEEYNNRAIELITKIANHPKSNLTYQEAYDSAVFLQGLDNVGDLIDILEMTLAEMDKAEG